MVENYFKSLVIKTEIEEDTIDPKIKKLIGIVKLPSDFDLEKAKEEY